MLLVLWALMVVAEAVLCLRVGLGRDALDWGKVLAGGCGSSQAAWRAHVKGVAHDGDVVVGLVDGVHFPATHVLAGDEARLVLEGDAVVGAFGYEVGIPLARRVEEVELLAPIALPLRLGAVVARRLGLVALEMALSTRQASCARALGLALGRGIAALSLLGRAWPASRSGRGIAGRGRHRRCHSPVQWW
jgi:hypothetical protein